LAYAGYKPGELKLKWLILDTPESVLTPQFAPNCLVPYLIIATASLGGAIITAASLSFLGLGVQPPAPFWGRDLFGSAQKFAALAPWMPIMPGIAISLTVYGFNLLGDAIRDILDPRLRGA
jgi:peptide/nickel transport system permease protein